MTKGGEGEGEEGCQQNWSSRQSMVRFFCLFCSRDFSHIFADSKLLAGNSPVDPLPTCKIVPVRNVSRNHYLFPFVTPPSPPHLFSLLLPSKLLTTGGKGINGRQRLIIGLVLHLCNHQNVITAPPAPVPTHICRFKVD